MTLLHMAKIKIIAPRVKEHNKLRIGILIIGSDQLDKLMQWFSHYEQDGSDLLLWND